MILISYANACIAALMYSGPLSQRITRGLPLHEMICLCSLTTSFTSTTETNSLSQELFLEVHLPQRTVFLLGLFHAQHHGDIHVVVLILTVIKHRCAGAQLS